MCLFVQNGIPFFNIYFGTSSKGGMQIIQPGTVVMAPSANGSQ
jgi:hypothetical protein